MKLCDYAKTVGISYLTAWRHYKAGKILYPTKLNISLEVINLADNGCDELMQDLVAMRPRP